VILFINFANLIKNPHSPKQQRDDFNHNKMKNDLLNNIYNKRNISLSQIKNIYAGNKYTAIEDISGNIGVCSNLDISVNPNLLKSNPDFEKVQNRIIVNALVNAIINPYCTADGEGDISEVIDFRNYRKIVMIGYFESLFNRLCNKGVITDVYDRLISDNPNISDIRKMQTTIPLADAIILTATTISNNTFNEIMNIVNANCHVYILGPSAILDRELLSSINIAGIFGAQFLKEKNEEITDIVMQGKGTKAFLHLMKKVYILRSDAKTITC